MTTTHDTFCTYGDDRGDRLVAYLYDDLSSDERTAIQMHLADCALCREELTALGAVRTELGRWAPPEPARALAFSPRSHRVGAGAWARLSDIPVWAQTAAALLFVGIGAAVANLNVHYDADGLTVRTGWSQQSGGGETVPARADLVTTDSVRPWQSDLAALEQELRAELGQSGQTAPSLQIGASADTGADRVRALLDESERRQRRELALRLADVVREVQAQRRDDLEKIDRSLGLIQANVGVMQNTGVEVMRQRQLLNDLVVRVSQRQ
jgi:hypothetical protein